MTIGFVQMAKGEKMTVSDVIILICGLLFMVADIVACWYLADWIIPQSEIDKIDAIGRWAKEELERREAERRKDVHESD